MALPVTCNGTGPLLGKTERVQVGAVGGGFAVLEFFKATINSVNESFTLEVAVAV